MDTALTFSGLRIGAPLSRLPCVLAPVRTRPHRPRADV